MSTIRDYAELSTSHIVAMVLVTTAATYCAARGVLLSASLIVTIAGIALLAAGTNAMNEVLEHAKDARMLRTRNRPIPSGRITPRLFCLLATMLLLAFATACSSDHADGKTIEGAAPQKTSTLVAPAAVAVIGDLQNPESVLHDPEQDVYFISNINGGELAADGNGFITRVDAKTFAKELKWIESGRNGVQLDGPKGMTILGDTLYVSDVTGVRKFDRRTGAPQGFIPIPNATFVNDLTNDGRNVYASDTGLVMGPGVTFLRTGTEAIWRISGDRATKIAAGVELKQPNGLLFDDGKLLVASFGANELYELSDDGTKADVTELPAGELDGIVRRKDGTLLVSSWKGDAVYRGSRGGDFQPVLLAIDAPADIGYDATRDRLLVPRAFLNQVTVHALR